MKRSLNEIGGDLRKAACGAGYPVGLAEDIAQAGICLVETGHDGVGAVADVLPKGERGQLSVTATIGPSVFDCLQAGEERFGLEGVDAPLLLAGFAISAARSEPAIADSGFAMTFSDGTRVIATSDGFSGELPSGSSALSATVERVETTSRAQDHEPAILDGVEINEDHLPLIKRWALEFCVPASEQSRLSGAGAGLTDND